MGRSRVSDLVNRAVSKQLGLKNAVGHTDTSFDEAHVLQELKHYLPTQTPLKDFIHHNTLHAFEGLPFERAVVEAGELFGCQPFLSETRYREELARGRIRSCDVDAVLEHELAEALLGEVVREAGRRGS